MTYFDQVELFLDRSYSVVEQKSFIFKSRCICNYVERALVEKNFETTLSRINIHCSKDESATGVLPLRGAPFLEVRIKYSLPSPSILDEPSLQRHFARIIDCGLKAAEDYMPIPRSYCLNVLRTFDEGGFENKWIQAQGNWENGSVRSDVVAQLTIEEFTMWQHMYRNSELIAKKQIVQTKPRKMLFSDYLGTLSANRSRQIVYKKRRKILTKFDLETNEFL